MYLREMGSVELLSREGEIAIAKRIEAGRDMMIGGLCESPLTFSAIISWHDQLKAGRMLLRDIIDLEATQGGRRAVAGRQHAAEPVAPNNGSGATAPPSRWMRGEDMDGDDEGEGPGMSLSALEEKLKPEVLATFEEIEALYKKLHKVQHAPAGDDDLRRGSQHALGEELREASARSWCSKVEQVRLHNNRIEELVTQLKQLNQRLTALEGQLLRMAESCKVPRDEFLKQLSRPRARSELGGAASRKLPGKGWKTFVTRHADDIANVRGADRRGGERRRPADRRVPPRLHDGEPRRARQRAGQEGDDRGEPAPGDLDRQEIHQSRPAVPGPDPGGQYRPDEGGR